ncbi:N-acetylmuramoyl-L-alanine amidase family protein [Deinococcus puniceus]|uniref:N-acetylmuramoyl-L-alanine amidase n=1 Tax=Deinococcus puniceus TaxID=1182568 RepID=A0A172TA83_9DEIO|nr:N-acetylmuramoyl-L-alanine amidase [Deinococcus puniceus]ANE43935.1 N-acetylmuramoyl-L-alanine amidase [Deinococcus puniceus]
MPLLSRFALLAALIAVPLACSARAAPDVFVAYPPEGHRVAFDHVILEGSVTPGANLKIGGQAVSVGADGLFMLWWPLRVGTNDLRLVTAAGGQTGSRTLRVIRTVPRALPATPTALDRDSVTPRMNLEFWDAAADAPAERSIRVSFRGSPGGRATFRLAGGAVQTMQEGPAGQYSATYTLPATARVQNAAFTVSLTGRDGRTTAAAAPGRLTSTAAGPRTATQRPGTVRGLGLNDATNLLTTLGGDPFLYPRNGMTFAAVGRQGDDLRVRLAPGVSALVTATQVALTPGAPRVGTAGTVVLDGLPAVPPALPEVLPVPIPPDPITPPESPAPLPSNPAPPESNLPELPPQPPRPKQATPQPVPAPPVTPVPTAPTSDLRVRVPLGGLRVPFTLDQTDDGRGLTLTLYGLSAPPVVDALPADPLLSRLTAAPAGPGVSRLTLELTAAQAWGFSAHYDGSDLLLTVRRPPALDPAQPLVGRVITLDAGHGGTQWGGAGSLRVPEKGLVLPITLRAAELLRAQGATVILTRTADVTLGLYERAEAAEAARADLLVSLHANALPDGRDPRGIRGPEIYFTHPQAAGVSAQILASLRRTLPDLGPGAGLKPGANLALTRPSTQISLLVELGYLTDPGNLRILMDKGGRERLAQAVAEGIAAFYAGQGKP